MAEKIAALHVPENISVPVRENVLGNVKYLLSFLPGRNPQPDTEAASPFDHVPVEAAAPTLHIDQADKALLEIAEDARSTLPVFYRHLLRPAKSESNFRIKYPFRADSGSGFSMEQLWLRDISFRNGVYYGVVANTPFYIASLKKGDTVTFSGGEITDWMYTQHGRIIGGLSIKRLLEQIPFHERSEEQRAVLQMFE